MQTDRDTWPTPWADCVCGFLCKLCRQRIRINQNANQVRPTRWLASNTNTNTNTNSNGNGNSDSSCDCDEFIAPEIAKGSCYFVIKIWDWLTYCSCEFYSTAAPPSACSISRIPNPPPREAIELTLQWVVVHRSLFGSLIVPHNLLQCVFNCDSTSKSSFDSPLTRIPTITGLQLTRPVSMRAKRGKLDILSSKTPCTQFNCDGLTGKENHLLRYPIISPQVTEST